MRKSGNEPAGNRTRIALGEREYQAGFRKGRSCAEQIFNLKTLIRARTLRNKNTVDTFVDFKKAYDSIDRQTVFLTLNELGIDQNTRRLIEQTLTDTTSKIKFLGETSEVFKIKTGVRQEDGFSPILSNLVLDKIAKTWDTALEEKRVKGVSIGQGKGKFEGLKAEKIAVALKPNIIRAHVSWKCRRRRAMYTGDKLMFRRSGPSSKDYGRERRREEDARTAREHTIAVLGAAIVEVISAHRRCCAMPVETFITQRGESRLACGRTLCPEVRQHGGASRQLASRHHLRAVAFDVGTLTAPYEHPKWLHPTSVKCRNAVRQSASGNLLYSPASIPVNGALSQHAEANQRQVPFPEPEEIRSALNIDVLRADKGERGEYGAEPECKRGVSRGSPRKPADHRHRPARFPHAKIPGARSRRGWNLVRIGGRRFCPETLKEEVTKINDEESLNEKTATSGGQDHKNSREKEGFVKENYPRKQTEVFNKLNGKFLAVSLLSSHQDEPGSVPGRVAPGFLHVSEVLRTHTGVQLHPSKFEALIFRTVLCVFVNVYTLTSAIKTGGELGHMEAVRYRTIIEFNRKCQPLRLPQCRIIVDIINITDMITIGIVICRCCDEIFTFGYNDELVDMRVGYAQSLHENPRQLLCALCTELYFECIHKKLQSNSEARASSTTSREIWVALNIEGLRADEGAARRVRGNREISEKTYADQRPRLAGVREQPRRESNPGFPLWETSAPATMRNVGPLPKRRMVRSSCPGSYVAHLQFACHAHVDWEFYKSV
ncbi:hypothetical protein PR048_006748 [Dryococelus australis]|uniref:Reverse transcriptase domain-containing protein n=1 Tax=Dryococelus australis TaxID=614101 RepID=A0ABQ9IBT8_9NEOP|nr:hypothetical protein PR048_006748 [Dryococelus australis]